MEATSATPKAAFTVREFCSVLSIGRSTFYEEMKRGRIKVLKLGARTLVPASEVGAFLQRLQELQS